MSSDDSHLDFSLLTDIEDGSKRCIVGDLNTFKVTSACRGIYWQTVVNFAEHDPDAHHSPGFQSNTFGKFPKLSNSSFDITDQIFNMDFEV